MSERQKTVFDTTFSELADVFKMATNTSRVLIPISLQKEFINLFERSENLQQKLAMVIDDPHHRAAMILGSTGFNLPHPDYLRPQNDELKQLLGSVNPYRGVPVKGGMVKVTPMQIDGFFRVFAKDHEIVSDMFNMFRKTDYLDYHRHLKAQGMKYRGPSSLQEVFHVYFGLARAQRKQKDYLGEIAESVMAKTAPQLAHTI